MARRRKNDETDYGTDYSTQEPESQDTALTDDDAMGAGQGEGATAQAETGPARYRVEQEGFSMRGEAFEKGEVIEMDRADAIKQMKRGINLIEVDENDEPVNKPQTDPEADQQPEGAVSDKDQRLRRHDTDTDRGQINPPTKP